MEQQQFRISFSLGSKLLLSVVSLLLVVIGFLTVSTILVLTEDKRAYTLKAQGTENVLAGLEFKSFSSRALSTLQLSLASYDPARELTPSEVRTIEGVLDNQSDIILTELGSLDRATGAYTRARTFPLPRQMAAADFLPGDLVVPEDWWKLATPHLLKGSAYFINLSKAGKNPLLGILRSDPDYKSSSGAVPVAIGYHPLSDFGSEIKGSRISIINQDGFVLHDSDPTVLYGAANLGQDPIFAQAIGRTNKVGAGEYQTDNSKVLGSYYHSDYDLVVTSRTDWRKAMSATYTLTEKFVLLGIMCITGAIIFALVFARTLTAPLLALYQATRQVAAGKFDLNLKPRSSDEIGALGSSFNVMSKKIQELIQESMKKVQLENELAIASTVQKTLFPPKKFENESILIHSDYRSASQCGGDWWGFFTVGDKLCLMIADATGHGMPSALITASARSCFSVMHKLAQEDPDFTYSPGAMLAFANRVVNEASSGQIMMTFFSCVLDFGKGELTYANAGHNPPWLFKREASGKYRQQSLTADGPRVGEVRDVEPFPEKSVKIAPGDVLFLYTDGIPEGKDRKGEMYGKKALKKLVETRVSDGPEQLVRGIMAAVAEHNTGKDLDDDVTIAVAQVK